MTLITYPTRVHFADDVLEEALHSELEREKFSRPLLILEESLEDTEFYGRVLAGLPHGTTPTFAKLPTAADLRERASATVALCKHENINAVLAFGTARAIELGRKTRGGLSAKAGTRLPFFAVPGLDGLPDPCRSNQSSWRSGLPSVLICDPTLTLGADRPNSLRAAINSLVRCVESYLSDVYNPPADGMALDGFHRCILSIPKIGKVDGVELRRDLMAAGLNGAMAQEKGLGPTQVLASALAEICDVHVADIERLVLPGIVEAMSQDADRGVVLNKVIGSGGDDLDVSLRALLEPLHKVHRLSELGIEPAHIDQAIAQLGGRKDITSPRAQAVLENVY